MSLMSHNDSNHSDYAHYNESHTDYSDNEYICNACDMYDMWDPTSLAFVKQTKLLK